MAIAILGNKGVNLASYIHININISPQDVAVNVTMKLETSFYILSLTLAKLPCLSILSSISILIKLGTRDVGTPMHSLTTLPVRLKLFQCLRGLTVHKVEM